MKILTENYIFNGGAIVTGGVRWIGERFSADLAMVVPTDGSAITVPPVNVGGLLVVVTRSGGVFAFRPS